MLLRFTSCFHSEVEIGDLIMRISISNKITIFSVRISVSALHYTHIEAKTFNAWTIVMMMIIIISVGTGSSRSLRPSRGRFDGRN